MSIDRGHDPLCRMGGFDGLYRTLLADYWNVRIDGERNRYAVLVSSEDQG